MEPLRLTRAHAELQRQQQSSTAATGPPMVPPCRSGGDRRARAGESDSFTWGPAARPGPQGMGGESRCLGQHTASSGSSVPVPVAARWCQGHSVSPGLRAPSRLCYRELLNGKGGFGFLPPPFLLLVGLCVSPALSSSQRMRKQVPFGWGQLSFIGSALGAKILFIQSGFRFSFQKLLSLPAGSFVICPGVPPTAPGAEGRWGMRMELR